MKASKLVTAVFVALSFVVITNGCDGGREGERCNPDSSHDECDDGLRCQAPATCVESYCCPTPASSSSNPYCNGKGCPGGGDAGAPADAGRD